MTAQDSGRPLEGVRALDFGQYVAGPMAATLLADAGAEVTRIEPPGGPWFTDPGNAYLLRGRAATHVLDLKSPEGRSRALALVAGADVLIENFRAGVMARLGLDADTCLGLNRGLVYCSLPGFSELDERAGLAGWEGVVMAAGGGYSRQASSPVFGGPTGQRPDFPSLPLASCFAAGMTALSACAALIARERDDGLGQRIEIPLSDALLEGSGILTTRVEKQEPMRGGVFAPGLYRSRDDQVMCFTSGAFRHLVGLAQVSGNEAWLEDGSLDWAALRTDPAAPAAWRAKLVSLFATRDADEWEALLRPAGIPVAKLRTTREWLREPAAEAAGVVTEQDDGAGHPVRTLKQAVDFGPAAPWADFKGYAEIANCAIGVSSLTAGWATAPSGAPPVNDPPWPYTDSMAGVLSAFGAVAALYDRGRRGHIYRVNTSLAQTALLEQMPFAVDGADADPFRGRDVSSATYRIYQAADRPVFIAIAAADLPEALRRLGAASADDLGARIASRQAEACVRALCFGRSAASLVETPAVTMAPDSFWARRGLRLELASEDFGTVVTQAPVARFDRTPAVAGDTPRVFGQGQPDGWTQ